jgi:hypothetical protein
VELTGAQVLALYNAGNNAPFAPFLSGGSGGDP